MKIDLNDEILQDFLIEAGEIIELLGEQLVDLEQNPGDKDLLNAIFRGFHTVKGGAGFLNIEALVEVCHRAEDVFNVLRQGERSVSSPLMDVILKVHDTLGEMFAELSSGSEPTKASSELLKNLEQYTTEENGSVNENDINIGAESPGIEMPVEKTLSSKGEITDDEFEKLLDALHGKGEKPSANNSRNDIWNKEEQVPITETVVNAENNSRNIKIASKKTEAIDDVVTLASPEQSKTAAIKKTQQESTVRVDTKRLDEIMNLVGELVLVRNRLATIQAKKVDEEVSLAVSNLDLVTSDLQTSVMKTRMQPIKKVFGRFPRVVRDLSKSLNKEVELKLRGEDTDLDKNLVEALADPLIHLVRNSVDHGIELPDIREGNGKPRQGTILLSAHQEGENIILTIDDDGSGIDPEIIKDIAVNKGIIDKDVASRLGEDEVYNLIFMPGFSTKQTISDVSGRGVGMDVVKTTITQLNGSISIKSQLGKGTVIIIKVPLTLAIMPTLMVVVSNQVYAMPLGSVVEIISFDLKKTKHVDGQDVIIIRDKPLPIFYLSKWLTNSYDPGDLKGHVVVVNVSGKYIGFVVDKLLGQEEVVIKPLGTLLQGIEGMSGATITGNGKISLILDMQGLMQKYAGGL